MSDNQLVQILQNMLFTPASDFYLSKLLHSPEQNSLDPCDMAEIDLGSFDVGGIPFNVVIKNFHVKGLSNTQVRFDQQGNPEVVVVGNKVSFTAKQPNTQAGYERPSDVPAQVEGMGELHINIAGSQMPPGSLSVTIKATDAIIGVFTAKEEIEGQLDSATITFSAFSLHPSVSGNTIEVVADLDTAFLKVINEILNRENSKQALLDEMNTFLASAATLASLSQKATEQARLALADFQSVPVPLPQSTSDLYMVLPKAMLDGFSASIFDLLQADLGSTSRVESLKLSVTWKMIKAPVFNFDYGYSSEIFSWCNSQLYLEIVPDEGGKSFALVDVSAKVYLNYGLAEGGGKYVYTCDARMLSFETDAFTKAVLMAKQSEILGEINAVMSNVVIPVLDENFIFPAKKTNESGPLDGGLLFDYRLDLNAEKNDPDEEEASQGLKAIDPNGFHAHIVSGAITRLIEQHFWEPLEKNYSEDGAIINLAGYELTLSSSSPGSIAIRIYIQGRVEIGSAKWSMIFAGPLSGHLIPDVNDNNEIKIILDGMESTFYKLRPETPAAVLLEWMIPGLTAQVQAMIRYRLRETLASQLATSEFVIYKFNPVRFDFKGRTLQIYPGNIRFDLGPGYISVGFTPSVKVVL